MPEMLTSVITRNKLEDFDLALAISEASLNNQLGKAWKIWTGETGDGPQKLRINPPTAKGNPSKTVLQATLGRPSISLQVERGGPNDVLLRFPLIAGTLVYEDEDGPVSETLDGRVFSIQSFLDRKVVTSEELYRNAPASGDQARKLIGASGVGEGAFSIECLFLGLTADQVIKAPDLEIDTKLAPRAGPVPKPMASASISKLAQCMAMFIKKSSDGERKLVLGSTVYPRRLERPASFALKDYGFKVTRTGGTGNTLDYLGVFFDGFAMPAQGALDNARAKLGPWLSAGQTTGQISLVSGMMAIRRDKVIGFFKDGLAKSLVSEHTRMAAENAAKGAVKHPETELPHPEADLLGGATVSLDANGVIRIANSKKYKWSGSSGGDTTYFELEKTLAVALRPVAGEGFALTGALKVQFYRNRELAIRNSRASATSTAPMTGKVAFEVGGGAIFCNVVPKVTVNFGEAVETSEEDGNWLSRLLNNNEWDKNQASGFAKASRTAIQKMLKESIEKVNVAMKDFAFIPPGEEVFTFSSPRFSPASDLFLDVIYKAPKPNA